MMLSPPLSPLYGDCSGVTDCKSLPTVTILGMVRALFSHNLYTAREQRKLLLVIIGAIPKGEDDDEYIFHELH